MLGILQAIKSEGVRETLEAGLLRGKAILEAKKRYFLCIIAFFRFYPFRFYNLFGIKIIVFLPP